MRNFQVARILGTLAAKPVVLLHTQCARRAFGHRGYNFFGCSIFHFYPGLLPGLKNFRQILYAIRRMKAFTGLPDYCDFSVGIFFFEIVLVHQRKI
jgi:hypothetical protein